MRMGDIPFDSGRCQFTVRGGLDTTAAITAPVDRGKAERWATGEQPELERPTELFR